ncbi:hypothetical protein ABLG96_20470 [Nakamurella sp. A5-74]|uniref:Uncharacterized protein n=1 Tax=Nakamurella sp. A5-74 TaxID=3158264 RepID=A0AAU8DP60_9ACTN
MSSQHEDFAIWKDAELDAALDDLLAAGVRSGDGRDATPRPAGQGLPLLGRRRWPVPLIAAAAVIATIVGVVAIVADRQRTAERRTAAAAVSVSDGVADVGGVRFPVPAGWSVAAYPRDDVVVACVAAAPSADCAGVTVTITVPGGPTLPNSFDFPVFGDNCAPGDGKYVQVDTSVALGGRPAIHYWGYCTLDAPQAHLWMLLDRSLAITTPRGKWADQGALIAAGVDLRTWSRQPGPRLIEWAEASEAVSSTSER